MVFGLFGRKSTTDDSSASPGIQHARLPTPTPSIASVVQPSPLRFPTALRSVLGSSTTDFTPKDSDQGTDSLAELAPPPPITPSPPPVGPSDTKALYELMLTIPPKTLHAYTLTHLRQPRSLPTTSAPPFAHPDEAPSPPSPNTISKLSAFFSTLAPPPLLHCVRCHKDFHDVDNEEKDKACRVPHDDESALVTRLPGGGGYETLWSCCGQTASGDGSEGPPDGWCYEGRHTTDIKRARFRADSSIHDDKLASCLKLNCRGIRDQLPPRDVRTSPAGTVTAGRSSVRRSNPSPARSQTSMLPPRSTRKRPRKSFKEVSGSENEADRESVVSRAPKDKESEKEKEAVGGVAGQGEGNKDTSVVMDQLDPKPKSVAKSRPIARARPPASTSTTVSLPPPSTKGNPTPAKPKPISRTLLSQSHTHVASDSEVSTRSRPRTRSRIREESRGRTNSKLAKTDMVERVRCGGKETSTSDEKVEHPETDDPESEREARGRGRKKRRVARD